MWLLCRGFGISLSGVRELVRIDGHTKCWLSSLYKLNLCSAFPSIFAHVFNELLQDFYTILWFWFNCHVFYWLIKKAMILTLILTWCTPGKGLYSADNSPELPLLSFDFFFFSQLGFKDGALSCKVLLGSHILNTYHVSQHDCLTKSVTWPQLCTKEWSWMSAAYQMPAWDVWL